MQSSVERTMDQKTAHALIEKNMFVFQKYLFNLHNIWNSAVFGYSNFQDTCQNVAKMTKVIEECAQNISKICQAHENHVPWQQVPSKRRKPASSQETTQSKRPRFN